MVAPEVCGDAEFPLINFTIKKILDLGFHLKLAVTNKLVILDRNHSLHCWKTNDTKIKTTGVSSKQSFKDYKLIYSWQFKKEWQICKKHVSSWNNSKQRSQFKCKWILLPFTSTFRSKTQIRKLSTKCSPLNTWFLSSSKGSDISPSEICSPGVAGGTDSGISPSEVGSTVEFPALSEEAAVEVRYQSTISWVVIRCNLSTKSLLMSRGSMARSSMISPMTCPLFTLISRESSRSISSTQKTETLWANKHWVPDPKSSLSKTRWKVQCKWTYKVTHQCLTNSRFQTSI